MSHFRIAIFLLLLLAITGQATAGPGDMHDAVALWQRVFARLPTLGQYLREGKRPEGSTGGALAMTLEEISVPEAANPFLAMARGALLTLTKGEGIQAEAAKASQLAGDRVAVRWLLYEALQRMGEEKAADRELQKIREIRDRLGLDRIAYVGSYLAHSAEVLGAHGDHQGAERAISVAEEFDPEGPEVFFGRARIALGRGSPQGLLPLIKGWWTSLTSPFYGPSHLANVLASFLLVIPVSLLLVGLVFLVRVTPLFRHDLAEWKRRKLSPVTEGFLPIGVYLAPVILGFGLLPAVLLSLLPMGIYLKVRERLLWGMLILCLLLLPGGYRLLATMITATTSPRYVAMVQVEEGDRDRATEAVLLRWAKERPHDPLPLYYLARMDRSRGEFDQGIKRYAQIQPSASQESVTWTNRGNLAFLAGDLTQAQAAYDRAITLSPDSAYARFNLSQLLTERLLLEQAQQEYAKAIRQMPKLQRFMEQATADRKKRMIIDAPLPVTDLWRQILRFEPASPEMAESLWGGRFLGVSLALIPWVVGGYLVAFGGIYGTRRRRRFARACEECGKAFCPRCQRLLGETRLCTRCAIIERARLGEMPPSIKGIPLEEAHREPRGLGLALVLIPGVEGLYRGKTLWGFLLLFMTLLAASSFLGTLIAPAAYLSGESLLYYVPGSILMLVCLYLLAILTYTGRRRWRWREGRWR